MGISLRNADPGIGGDLGGDLDGGSGGGYNIDDDTYWMGLEFGPRYLHYFTLYGEGEIDVDDADRFDRATGAGASENLSFFDTLFGSGFGSDQNMTVRDEPVMINSEFSAGSSDEQNFQVPNNQSGEHASDWICSDTMPSGGGSEGSDKSLYERSIESLRDTAVGDFVQNYMEMRERNTIGSDRYHHCMANCQAASRGTDGLVAAKAISYGREGVDSVKNLFKGYSMTESFRDIRGDMEANRMGWQSGSQGLRCLDACLKYKPNGY